MIIMGIFGCSINLNKLYSAHLMQIYLESNLTPCRSTGIYSS